MIYIQVITTDGKMEPHKFGTNKEWLARRKIEELTTRHDVACVIVTVEEHGQSASIVVDSDVHHRVLH
jgi:hypothetical protein